MPTQRKPKAAIRFTSNFEDNLAQIEAYWDDNQFPAGYDRLLDELTDTTLLTLEQHPRLGRPFFDRLPFTVHAKKKAQMLKKQLEAFSPEAELREYVMTDYTVLYALISKDLYLLAIKHHKQLTFQIAH
jgi:hypothetical protein